MTKQILRRALPPLVAAAILWMAGISVPAAAQEPLQRPSVVHKVKDGDRLEMTVNTSLRLTLEQRIKDIVVNNDAVLEPVALSPNTIQISATAPGVTQVNLFAEDGEIYTVDVIVYGDAQELTLLLRAQFPHAALRVVPVASGVLISGYVDQPGHVQLIMRIAEEFYPTVLNNITVSGVQQVLLHVKVMEVSRTKLRAMGFDWTQISGQNVFHSAASGLISAVVPGDGDDPIAITRSGDATFSFNVLDGGNAFFGVIEALREDKLAKILAEPTLVTVSGRPAFFHVGGEFGYQLNGGITGPSVEFKKYGTRVDFVPIVLGNGRIRLEVRPQISEIDAANSVQGIPALRIREVETGVEMKAGQTLAIAGLIQNRIEAQNRGLPWISEIPLIGMAFRRVEEVNNEVELLIMVTPELVEAMDAHEVPLCGPGMRTTNPTDGELFFKGHLEVPNCGPPCDATGYAQSLSNTSGTMHGGMIIREEDVVTPRAGRANPAASHNRYTRSKPQLSAAGSPPARQTTEPGFIGPIGYDVLK